MEATNHTATDVDTVLLAHMIILYVEVKCVSRYNPKKIWKINWESICVILHTQDYIPLLCSELKG